MSNLRSAVRVDVLGGEALGFLGLQGLSSADGGRFGLRRPANGGGRRKMELRDHISKERKKKKKKKNLFRWRQENGAGKTFESIDPRNGEVLANVAEAEKEDIDLAVKAARVAFDHGPWPRLSGFILLHFVIS
ncbi:hypothetical protein F8388_012814 [Cannabis sativa]|uniref:Aldehyde dehydrogenase domain-containing protein n=1 Tax=Cannabis sativa TaxID=3483 RepID=A0A7J6F6D5_CANSA|nr:hypothetical protein F8388_012814 [Cannabis sativa]